MFLIKLLFRNAFRHKLRTMLTITGIAIAILSFGLLRTVVSAWYAGVDASSASRLVTRNAISLIFMLPASYKDKIRQIEGVNIVSWGNWFGGVYISEKNFFPNFAIDPKSYFELYPEFILRPEEQKAFLHDRRACVAGRLTANKYGWKLGDTITLRGTIFPGNWDFVLRGIYHGRDRSSDESQFFFNWQFLNESLKKSNPALADQIGFFMIGVKHPEEAAETAAAIDRSFRNSGAETITESEKAFQMGFVSMSEAIVVAIQIISFVVIAIIMAVVANTMAMSARERTGEYVIIRTLGFGSWHLAGLIVGESFVISMTGCLIGILATFPAAEAFGNSISTFLPVFHVSHETIYLDILASAIVAAIAAVIPTFRIIHIGIAEGLRKIG